jgi:hypothetical protein
VRGRLEEIFARIDLGEANAIRSALLESAHLKLMKRFVGFVAAHVTNEFFTTQAEGLTRALPKSKLEQSLKNLYTSRSGFVHQLKKVREQLRVPWTGPTFDVFDWDNEPYLTFPGLVRLVHHVLSTFISRQPVLEREDYPAWRDELPGTMQVEMAPRYWIWQAEGFTPQKAGMFLSGLLHHLADMLASGNRGLPNMSAVMRRIEELISGCSPADRIPMLALYQLYNALAPKGDRRPRRREILGRHGHLMECCSIAFLSLWPLLPEEPIPWSAVECVSVFEGYQKKRYKATAIHLPVLFEVAVMATIANLYLQAGDWNAFVDWVDRAILDAAGRKAVQEMLADCRTTFSMIDTRRLVGLPPVSEKDVDDFEDPQVQDGADTQPLNDARQPTSPE